uniref:IrrE N-terminal-like domain-containing protein n=1 Tax=Dulem virus 42 TaxID=3145760 RepID=A0AAU8B7V9_9CAUD
MNSKTVKSKKKKKSIIDIYNPVIYPIELHVCKNVDYSILSKKYELEGHGKDIDIALTIFGVKELQTDKSICLVILNSEAKGFKDKANIVNTCAHEASHYVIDMFDFIGNNITQDTHEPVAYLAGWAASCIYKTAIK